MTIPQLGFLDRVIFLAAAGGTGTFTFASAVLGFQSPIAAGAADQQQYGYAAQSADLTQWEYGYGTWSSGPKTLTRTVLGNSLSTTSPINFTAPPNVLLTLLAETMANVMPLASGFLHFFVATTGSDSNPGTVSQPFATIQRALNVASQFNYQGFFFPTIFLADGTYVINDLIHLPPITNFGGGTPTIQGTSTPGNVHVWDQFNNAQGIFYGRGSDSVWQLDRMWLDSKTTGNFGLMTVENDAKILVLFGNMIWDDSSNNASMGVFSFIGNGGEFDIRINTVSMPCTNYYALVFGLVGLFNFRSNTVTLSASPTSVANFIFVSSFVQLTFLSNTYNNIGHSTFGTSKINEGVLLFTDTGLPADIPGGAPAGDYSCLWTGNNNIAGGQFFTSIVGLPTTSNIAPGTAGVFKDTSGGGVYLAANDAGTIRKVQLT